LYDKQILNQREHCITKENQNKRAHPYRRLTEELQEEQSPDRDPSSLGVILKWGLGGGEPGSTPSGHSGEIAFTCAPAADSALASGGQSEVQAVIQQFPYTYLLTLIRRTDN